jgi:hypothetical protein
MILCRSRTAMDLITVRRLQPIWSAMVWWEGQAW